MNGTQSTRDDGYITTRQAAMLARVRPDTILVWVHRGHLEKAGLDERGNNLYRPLDVARAEQQTRKAARRIIIPNLPPEAA